MLDDPVMLLPDAGEEAGDVDEGQDRNVEGVAEAHEARRLLGRIDVEHAGQHHRLVGDDSDRAALDPAEADDDVGGVRRLDLEEVALVGDLPDQLVHVVGRRRARRDQRVEAVLDAVDRVLARPLGTSWRLRQRQEIEELARRQQRVDVVLERDVGDAATWSCG